MLSEVYIHEIYSSRNALPNQKATSKKQKPYTTSDLEYLCKYWEFDDLDLIATALDRSTASVKKQVSKLKQKGLYQHYKSLNKHW